MKPLTIEQMKTLKPCDWIWIERPKYVEGDKGGYYKIIAVCIDGIVVRLGLDKKAFMFSDMGDLWLAYKNKEQAEEGNNE